MSGFPGILAIFNNIPPGTEAEFEEWFQHEHLLERIAVPGFVLGRRHEAVSGTHRYFNYYQTSSPYIFKSAPYLERLDNPTPMTRHIMSKVFKDMNRTVCWRTLRVGQMRGVAVVVARFMSSFDHDALKGAIDTLMKDKAVACGEIWTAVDPKEFPVSEEERLRGGDKKIAGCLIVETTRVADAERIGADVAKAFPAADLGVYRVLCEIRPKDPA
jgi:hypothetical protein